jgi:hypothetical protein
MKIIVCLSVTPHVFWSAGWAPVLELATKYKTFIDANAAAIKISSQSPEHTIAVIENYGQEGEIIHQRYKNGEQKLRWPF